MGNEMSLWEDDIYSSNKHIFKEITSNTCKLCKKHIADKKIICDRCKAKSKKVGKGVGKAANAVISVGSFALMAKPIIKK